MRGLRNPWQISMRRAPAATIFRNGPAAGHQTPARLKQPSTGKPMPQRPDPHESKPQDLTAQDRAGDRPSPEAALRAKTRELEERLKELDCLYGISRLIEKTGASIREILEGAAAILPSAWQYPEIACARVAVDSMTATSSRFKETPWVQSQPIKVGGRFVGHVAVFYCEKTPPEFEGPFLREERNLLNEVAETLGRVIERLKTEETLRHRERELAVKNQELQEVNTALKVLLRQREKDRAELEENVARNIKELILPYLNQFRSAGLSEGREEVLEFIEESLKNVASGFQRRLTDICLGITPTELRVAELIRQGKTTKEIADLLNSSTRAVDFHRSNLRRKLQLKDRKTNLRSFLMSTL